MTISTVNNNRDVKIVDKDGNRVLATIDIGSFNPPALTDAITVEYPSGTTEIYRYRQGGLAGSILKSVTVTYTTSGKQDIASVEVV